MEIESIRPEEFPSGVGGHIKGKQEYIDCIQRILSMKTEDVLKISSCGPSRTSANSLRSLVIAELERRRKRANYDVVTRDDGERYNLYVRRNA